MGFWGMRALAGVEALRDGKWRLMIAVSSGNKMEVIEQKVCDRESELHKILEEWPGVPIILLVNAGAIGKWVDGEIQNPVKEVLGVGVGNMADFVARKFPGKIVGRQYVVICRRADIEKITGGPGARMEKRIVDAFITEEMIPYWQEVFGGFFSLDDDWFSLNAAIAYTFGNPSFSRPLPIFEKNINSLITEGRILRWGGISISVLTLCLLMGLGIRLGLSWRYQEWASFIQSKSKEMTLVRQQGAIILELKKQADRMNTSANNETIVSALSDQIALQTGKEIVLDELIFMPKEQQVRKIDYELIKMKPDILLKGRAESSGAVSELMLRLEAMKTDLRMELFYSGFDYEQGEYEFVILGKFGTE